MQFPLPIALLPLVLGIASCGGGGSGSSTNEQVTFVAVSPQDFLGDVPCTENGGGMRHYVATLIDVTNPGTAGAAPFDEFALPSSPPTPCDKTVAFGRVRPDRAYSAAVEGYSHSDLQPLSPGSPTMLNPETGEVVTPEWTTLCGDPEAVGVAAPAIARSRTTVYVRGCKPFEHTSTSSTGSASFALSDALGELSCGTEIGQVAAYRILRGSEQLDQGDCRIAESVVSVPTDDDDAPFRIEAFEDGRDAATWAAACTMIKEDLRDTLQCEALTNDGSASLDLTAALDAAGTTCEPGASVTITEDNRELVGGVPFTCTVPLTVEGLQAGEHELLAVVSSGSDVSSFDCSVTIEPAAVTRATCEASTVQAE